MSLLQGLDQHNLPSSNAVFLLSAITAGCLTARQVSRGHVGPAQGLIPRFRLLSCGEGPQQQASAGNAILGSCQAWLRARLGLRSDSSCMRGFSPVMIAHSSRPKL